ncbi:protein eva-1 homolog C isoform X2 [Harmonia axyridis]|uniref:protein eva-1 homolog C isoform X2 n=1 Tax=Harmonia axyridis TaxID=115357 RepID=UPI001E279C53|nr:protein eva-1 homolog C isoform X2 [Harmonia axyridis]
MALLAATLSDLSLVPVPVSSLAKSDAPVFSRYVRFFVIEKMTSFIVLVLLNVLAVSGDNLALLSGTLRTFQKASCDEDTMTLKCPSGTSISIQLAQYGKSAPSRTLCNSKTSRNFFNMNLPCLWPTALQTVVEACQKKRQCKFRTSPNTFGGDPCPGVPKYVEVAFKCRPYEFRSANACENERVHLKCNPNFRIAILSASYGRTEYESIQCPQPQGVPEETCLVSYATETVMNMCHGKRTCEISADVRTFGSPCRPESRMYLKVVHTCVPRKVLKDQYDMGLEPDEVEEAQEFSDENDKDDFDSYDVDTAFIGESAASPSAPNSEEAKGNQLVKDEPTVNAKSPSQKSKDVDIERQELYILYLIISIASGVVICLTILVGRLLVQRKRAKNDSKSQTTNISDNSLPNGFTDDISEVDADIDLTAPHPVPTAPLHPVPIEVFTEVVHYPHVHSHHTFLRNEGVEPPRSISGSSNPHFYYG